MRRWPGPSPSVLWRAVGRALGLSADRWLLWTPVAFGGGAAIYFGLKVEPPLWLVAAPALIGLMATVLIWRWGRSAPLAAASTLIAALALGLLVGKARTVAVAAPIVPVMGAADIQGWVVDVASPGSSGPRLVIAPTAIAGLPPDQLPQRIRVSVKAEDLLGPGVAIRLKAGLSPPPAPAGPGAYDFARDAYFQGIGGVGFALGQPQIISLPDPPLRFRLVMAINQMRWRLTRQITDDIAGSAGGIAAAMITGYAPFIDQADVQAMRDSGLAHILSISGLHMAIVGGFVFFGLRLMIAAWPWLALRVNGKKTAAVIALGALLLYLVVAGWPPPAERSAITAAVAFGAILFERRAVTLRGLALAALIVLLLQPEAVTQPGFQMSFAATAALVALAEIWPHRPREINTPWPLRLLQRGGGWIVAGLAASLVAGLATDPFAIQYFNRVALYSLPANLAVEPLSSFVFMPALAIGSLLTPVGLGHPFLAVGGWGIQRMMDLAHAFAQAPKAVLTVASAPDIALPIAFLGILWLCLGQGRGRLLGAPLALAVFLWPRPAAPDLWIAGDGANAALSYGGQAILLRPDSRLFAANLWARRRGLVPAADTAVRDRLYNCDRFTCRFTPGAPIRLSSWFTRRKPSEARLSALCADAELLILRARIDPPPACRGALILDPDDFDAKGAAEIWRRPSGWRIVWTQPARGERPWTRPTPLTGSAG